MLAIRNPQSVICNPADWLTADQAAERTGEPVRTWQWRAQREALDARQQHRQALARKAPPPAGRGKPVWWVHRRLDRRLSPYYQDPDRRQPEASLLERYPAAHVELAHRKAHWLDAWRQACRRPRVAGLTDVDVAAATIEEARRTEGEGFRISVRSLQHWHKLISEIGPDGRVRGLEALVPKYTRDADDNAPRSPEAIDYFYSLYHVQKPFSVRACHDATQIEAIKRGWVWPKAYTATTRWLRENDRLDLTCLMREGHGPYSHKYMPHTQTDWDAIEPGEMYVTDHAQCDFWVQHGDRQIRPWLTAIQDMRSRCITGWHLGVTPHQDAIVATFRQAFRDWAIPEHMRIDNGKDFCSELIAGLTKAEVRKMRREFGRQWKDVLRAQRDHAVDDDPRWYGLTAELGIDLIRAIPYAPWSKGTIERWFGTFHDQCGKTFVTYCGNSPQTRPDGLDDIRRGRHSASDKGMALCDASDVPTLDEAAARIGDYIDLYHRTEHRGDGMRQRTPLQVWATATRLRRAAPEALAFLMTIRGAFKVGGNGVGITIGGERFGYGATSHALRRHVGRKVLVSYDPRVHAEAWAFDAKTRKLIGRLEANKRTHPCATGDDVRQAIADVSRDRKVGGKAQRSAARRNRTATQRVNAAAGERLAELRATGTDDAQATANIVPVRTGFEGVSTPARSPAANGDLKDDGSIADLFAAHSPSSDDDDDQTMADLFDDDADDEAPDEGFEDLL